MAEKKKDPNRLRTYKREIPVDLTDHEIELYGRKLAAKKRERDGVVEKAKQTAATYKGQIADISAEVDRLAAAINTGKELRNTEVYDVLEGSQVFTKRSDTNEVIDQRPAGYADEQTDMFADPEAPAEDFPNPEPAATKPKGKGGKGKGGTGKGRGKKAESN